MLKAGHLILLSLIVLLIPIAILFHYTINDKPTVSSFLNLTNEDIEKAKEIIFHQVNSTTATPTTLVLTERDLNIAANHLLNRHFDSATQVTLEPRKLNIVTSIDISNFINNRFVNISFDLTNQQGQPDISSLIIGSLHISDKYAKLFLDYIINHTALNNYLILANRYIRSIQLQHEKVSITYIADQETINQARKLVAFPANNETLVVYQRKLATIIRHHPKGWLLSLSDLLQPLFTLAYSRSNRDNAIEENRHVIFVVNSYVNKNQWQNYFPKDDIPELSPPSVPVYVYKRIDLAQHFIASAALTSSGSSYVANLIGFKKEIKDSGQGGSGFSFIDLAADRAGMYFGKMATSSVSNARKMQRAMSQIKDYRAFIPDVRDLPDRIDQQTLIKQYQSVDSHASQEILKNIDDRIKACSLYDAF